MRLLTFIIIVLFVTILGAVLAIDDPGYVLIARPPWSIEMPLTLFLPLLFVLATALYLFGFVFIRTWLLPRYFSRWRGNVKNKKARQSLNQGLVHLAEAEWSKAEKTLLTDLEYSDTPVLNYLGAAYASQELGDNEKRDDNLSQAYENAPEDSFAIGLTQARLQHIAKQYEQELATLFDLRKQKPRHNYLLKQLIQVYRELSDWSSLATLLPELRKRKVLSDEDTIELEKTTHREILLQSLPNPSMEALERNWQAVPLAAQKHPDLIGIYAQELINFDKTEKAESLLRGAISKQWNDKLVGLYGLAINDAARQLKLAKSWLNDQPGSAALLLTLGRLSSETGQLEAARGYFDKAADIDENAETYQAIGQLLEKQGNLLQAVEYYRRGLECVGTPAPHPNTTPRLAATGSAA